MPVLVAFIGMAVDVGYLELQKRRMQTAADAGAVGGVQELVRGNDYTMGAKNDTASNGFTDGANGTTVNVYSPPSTGTYAGKSNFVEVSISQPQPTFFMQMFSPNTVQVSARSVAGLGSIAGCIWTLDPSAQSLLNGGGGTVTAPCGVVVNSNNPQAIVSNGSPECINGPVRVVGGTVGCVPNVTNIPSPLPDPLRNLPAPVFGGCDHTNFVVSSGPATLWPGVYCGGMRFNDNKPITFNPGTYILLGGGFTDSGGATYTGTGVTFYNTADASHPYGPITFSGGGPVNLSAPTSGPLQNILFFQDRNISSAVPNTFSGGNTFNLSGTIYLPTTVLLISGASTPTPMNVSIIADMVQFTDSTKFSSLGAAANGGTASIVALAE